MTFLWGMIAGGVLIGALWHAHAKRQRRKLRDAEKWIAELEQRAEELWTKLR